MPPKCPYCSCEKCEISAVDAALRANYVKTKFKCCHCTCSEKPKH